VPRSENDKADALAKLVASLTLPNETEIQIIFEECHMLASALDLFDEAEEINVVSVFEVEEEQIGDNLSLSTFNMASYPLIQREEYI